MKLINDDYKGREAQAALEDFRERVRQYEAVYEPVAGKTCAFPTPSRSLLCASLRRGFAHSALLTSWFGPRSSWQTRRWTAGRAWATLRSLTLAKRWPPLRPRLLQRCDGLQRLLSIHPTTLDCARDPLPHPHGLPMQRATRLLCRSHRSWHSTARGRTSYRSCSDCCTRSTSALAASGLCWWARPQMICAVSWAATHSFPPPAESNTARFERDGRNTSA